MSINVILGLALVWAGVSFLVGTVALVSDKKKDFSAKEHYANAGMFVGLFGLAITAIIYGSKLISGG